MGPGGVTRSGYPYACVEENQPGDAAVEDDEPGVVDVWAEVAVPLLELILSGESRDRHTATQAVFEWCRSNSSVQFQLAALIEDGYVEGATAHWGLGRDEPMIVGDLLRLTPKGRRAAGQWPFADIGSNFLRALEAAVLQLPEGETKSRLRSLLAAAQAVGTEVLTGVLSNVAKGALGLP